MKEHFVNGAVVFFNYIAELLWKNKGIAVNVLQVPDKERADSDLIIFTVLLVIVFLILIYGLLQLGNIWLLLFVRALFPVICIWIKYPTGVFWGTLYGIGTILNLLYLTNLRFSMLMKEGIFYVVLILCMVFCWNYSGLKSKYTVPVFVTELRTQIIDKTEQLRYKNNMVNSLPNGKISTAGNWKTSEKTALKVTMENPQSMYLKGFVGTEYKDGTWQAADKNITFEKKDLFYWLHQDGFFGTMQLSKLQKLLKKNGKNVSQKIRVENVNGNSRYYYVPYEMNCLPGEVKEIASEDTLYTTGLYGDREYSFETDQNLVKDFTALAAEGYPRRMQFAQKVFLAAMPESGYLPGPISFPWQDDYYYANACSLKCLDPEVADVSVSGSNISVVPKKTGAARVIAQWNKDKSNYTTFQINVLGVSVSAADDSENKYIYIDPADETVVPQLQLKAEGSGASSYTYYFNTRGPKDAIPDSVEGYLCVGSQYTNMGSYGLTPERTLVNGGGVLSVGGFGGYITWKYDKPIENSKNNPFGIDFIVYGNPFAASQSAAEPGNVMVSQDGENWYYLAGSMHYDDEADWNYSVTYTNNAGQSFWTDNRGNSGTNYKFPEKNLYPYYNWTEDQHSVTVNGLKLVSNAKDPYGSASAAFPDFGYVDINLVGNNRGVASNPYAGSHLAGGDGFDIDWAVDANGMPVHLDSISYIRVSTASHIYAGAIGEKSTEVTHAYRVLNPSETAVGTTDAPVSVTVDGTEVSFDSQVATAIYAGDGLEVKVDAPEGTNVYINGSYGHERTYETAPEKRIIRIITQEGEKEPDIRYIRLVRSDEVRGLTLSAEELKLNETETAVLTAAIIPENAANKNVIWTSSDENVAAVAANGKVTAVKAGTAIITCTSEEKADVFAECIVTVSSLPVPTEPVLPTAKSITLNTASLSLHYGKTAKLQATVKPDNAKNKKVVWSSSDGNVAEVKNDGKVTATGIGTAIITCASVDNKNVKAVCKVTVTDNTFMRLKATAYTTSAKLNWTKIESADGYEVYGSKCGSDVKKIKTIKNKNTLSWTHSNLKKGTSYKYIVKAYKLVGGKKNYYKKSYSVHLTTKGGKYTNAKKVTVSADKITLTVGKSKKLTAKVSKVDSSKKIIKHANVINWKSTDTKIAKVSSDGRIQAVGKGTCSVYAYAGNGVYAKVKVTVK